MCRSLVYMLCAFALVVFLATMASAGTIQYYGGAVPGTAPGGPDPLTQGWIHGDGANGWGTSILDGQTLIPSWQVTDGTPFGQGNSWWGVVSEADADAALADGFTVSAKLRMDSLTPGSSYMCQGVAYHDTLYNRVSAGLSFNPSELGDGSIDVFYFDGTNALQCNVADGATAYHDYRLEYDATTTAVTFKIDNVVIADDLALYDNSVWGTGWGTYIQFGDGTGWNNNNATANYYEALWATGSAAYTAPPEYIVPEPGTLALLGCGLLSLLAYAWRKRK